jgi:Tetratricopeptide repeat
LFLGSFVRPRAAIALLGAVVLIGTGGVAFQAHARTQAATSGDYTGISVQANEQIFATMCALDAAGFAADESTLGEMPGRLALRAELLKMQGPATAALRQFYRDHVLMSSVQTLSPYITFALIAGPPPDFDLPSRREFIPPDLSEIDGFQPVLSAFYQEARLSASWTKIEPEYQPAVARYESLLSRIVFTTNGYLRELAKASNGRTFTIFVEPMVGARVNFRNYGSRYAIVVGSVPDPPVDLIQHAYLHFMLDPLILSNRKAVEKKRPLLAIATTAPRLPVEYRDDFVGFVDENFVKAVELRLRHLAPAPLESALHDADESGFILVRPFVAQLQKFEKAEPAMTYYFPDLIGGIDVDAEMQRLKGFAFAAGEPAPEEQGTGPAPSELDTWLAEGDREIAQKNGVGATAAFEKVLAKYPNNIRATYGLAIASVLSGDGDRARDLFEKIVASSNSESASAGSAAEVAPDLVAWSHVYLGRIHDLEDERDQAIAEYQAALAVDGAPELARLAAQNGVSAAYKPPSRSGDTEQPQQ